MAAEFVAVAGNCPMGCGTTLFVGAGGHVTCSWHVCPRPRAADEILHLDAEHRVELREKDFVVEHPLRERLEGTMDGCELHAWLHGLDEAPAPPGRYVAVRHQPDAYSEPYDADPWDLEPETPGGTRP